MGIHISPPYRETFFGDNIVLSKSDFVSLNEEINDLHSAFNRKEFEVEELREEVDRMQGDEISLGSVVDVKGTLLRGVVRSVFIRKGIRNAEVYYCDPDLSLEGTRRFPFKCLKKVDD